MRIFYATAFLFFCLLLGNTAWAQLVINEVQTYNDKLIADEDFEYPAWLELYNSGTTNIALSSYYLSDNAQLKTKYKLPNVTLKPKARMLVFISGKDTVEKINHWETVVFPYNNWRYSLTDTMWTNTTNPYGIYYPNYDASGWALGKGGIGVGDGDDSTVIQATSNYTMRQIFKMKDKSTTNLKKCYLMVDNENQCYAFLNYLFLASFSNNSAKHIRNGDPPRNNIVDINAAKAFISSYDSNLFQLRFFQPKDSFHQTAIAYLSLGYSDTAKHTFGNDKNPYLKDSLSFVHTNFKLKPGETIYLFDKNGSQIDKKKTTYTPTNVSFARIPDGGSWCMTDQPSPDSSNNGKNCMVGFLAPPAVSLKSGLVSKNALLKLYTNQANCEIRYTTNGSIPSASSKLFQGSIKITSDILIRAICIDTSKTYLPSKPITNLYVTNDKTFKLPIVSIAADSFDLFNSYDGLYTTNGYVGEEKRSSHIEYLSPKGITQFELDADLSIHGNGSRGYAKKSLRVEVSDKYDSSFIHYKLFPFRDYTDIYSFNLRSGSQDQAGALMRDELTNHMMLKTNLDVMEHQTCMVYLNGMPWGLYHIREKQDNEYLENISGISRDSVDLIGIGGVHNGTANAYYSLITWQANDSLFNKRQYDSLCKYLDILNFADYIIIESFVANADWPGNNTKLWRPNINGGKFRYLLYDTDYGTQFYYLKPNKLQSLIASNFFGLYYLTKNTTFKNYFINRYADLMNTILNPSGYSVNINYFKNNMISDMPKEISRWNNFGTLQNWIDNVSYIDSFVKYSYLANRDSMVSTFKLNKKVDLNLKLSSNQAGLIKLNTIIPQNYPWKGVYYDGAPITVTAIPNPGYTFDSFVIDSVTYKSKTVTVNLTKNSNTITAYFNGSAVPFQVSVSEINYNCSDNINSGNWVELHNYSNSPIDLTGYKFKTKHDYAVFQFPDNYVLGANKYVVICEDSTLFKKIYPSTTNRLGNIRFPLDNQSDSIVLIDNKGKNRIAFVYTDSLPWPECADGTGRTLELRNDSLKPNIGFNWFNGCIGGSPGKAYSSCTENIIISEINYNSKKSADAGDWIELYNTSNYDQNISNWHFKDDDDTHDFLIPAGTIIKSHQYLVLANSRSKFKNIYPNVSNVKDSFEFSLSSNGEILRLFDSKMNPKFSMVYHNEDYYWPAQPNGGGYTLEYHKNTNDVSEAQNWSIGCYLGSPGYERTICPEHIQFVATEINHHSLLQTDMGDWMEWQNISTDTLYINNWQLSTQNSKVSLPTMLIAPNEFVIISNDTAKLSAWHPQLNKNQIIYNSNFSLSDSAENIQLIDTNGFPHFVMSYNIFNKWDTMANGNGYTLQIKKIPSSISSYSDSSIWQHGCFLGNPLELTHSCEEKISISEINFQGDSLKQTSDWVELYNYGNRPINLNGYSLTTAHTSDKWTQNYIFAPQQRILISNDSNNIRNNYGLPSEQLSLTLNTADTVSVYNTFLQSISQGIYDGSNYVYAQGLGKTLETSIDSVFNTQWQEGCLGGSPAAAHTACKELDIIVSEINYQPVANFNTGLWFELQNIDSINTKDISNYYISFESINNLKILDSNLLLTPKSKIILIEDSSAFKFYFPFSMNSKNITTKLIRNGWIRIWDSQKNIVFAMKYDPSFGGNGNGKTIQISNPIYNMSDYSVAAQWEEGCIGGSPENYNGWCDTNILVSEINYQSSIKNNSGDWFELYNPTSQTIDLNGMYVYDSKNQLYTLKGSLMKDSFLVLAGDSNKFSKEHKDCYNKIVLKNLELDEKGSLRLYDKNKSLIYLSKWDYYTPWNDSADGKGYTLEYNANFTDFSDATSWFIGCLGGSPGKPYASDCYIKTDTINNQSLPNQILSHDISISPNPFNSDLQIDLEKNTSLQNLTIYDAKGSLVLNINRPLQNKFSLDLSHLKQGIYILLLNGHDGTQTYKIVKE